MQLATNHQHPTMSATNTTMTASNVVNEICRVCVLTFKLTNTHTITPAMVLYAVEVLFKTKMDAEVDDSYEKEHKKEINKVSREMAKFIETMRTGEEKKFRIGGNAPTLVFRAMKQFGQEEPVQEKEKKTKKTKKTDAAAPEVVEPEPQTPVYQEPEPEHAAEEKKTNKKTTKTAKKEEKHAEEAVAANVNAEDKPKKTAAKKTKDTAAPQEPTTEADAAQPKEEKKTKTKTKKAATKTETEPETAKDA